MRLWSSFKTILEKAFSKPHFVRRFPFQFVYSPDIVECRMQIIQGIPASPGFAAGPAFRFISEDVILPRFKTTDHQAEWKRLEDALQAAKNQVTAILDNARLQVSMEEAAIFEAHLLFLEDPDLLNMVQSRLQEEQVNAEAAWAVTIETYAQMLEGMENEYFAARAADVRDVGRRVLRLLMDMPEDDLTVLQSQAVIIARDLTPSDTVRLDKKLVLALCTAEGGPTSHTAILAKSLGIPAVVGAGPALLEIPQGTQLFIDAEQGQLMVDADSQTVVEFENRRSMHEARKAAELSSAAGVTTTQDGHTVEVVANIGGVEDARAALKYGADGVGLFRTEFLYLERHTAPDEEEQFSAYAEVMATMGNRPVVVRTMDIGGDKELPYLDLGDEANPFLGYRAIRISLAEPDMFKVQLRALLRAAHGHDMRIMFPMVATLDEVRRAKALLAEARQELNDRGIPQPEHLQVGIMVEIPSVVVMADLFACEVDFFSVGTNDLTQYTFAAERTNDRVAHLSDACHPAILRQIRTVIDSAHGSGIWAGVCGELAGDPDAIPLLLGLGLDEFSMAAPMIPQAKAILRRWTKLAAQELALKALEQETAEDVRRLVRSYGV
jgi:phosphoenolpyruvate-protein phosphotransferase